MSTSQLYLSVPTAKSLQAMIIRADGTAQTMDEVIDKVRMTIYDHTDTPFIDLVYWLLRAANLIPSDFSASEKTVIERLDLIKDVATGNAMPEPWMFSAGGAMMSRIHP